MKILKNKTLLMGMVMLLLSLLSCENQKSNAPNSSEIYRDIIREENKVMSDIDKKTYFSDENYGKIIENVFLSPKERPLSTFSIDVDGASYANVRRIIQDGYLPDKNAIRLEEFINYFNYSYPEPSGKHPFTISTDVVQSPWNQENRLVRIGLKGKSLDMKNLKPSNLVFLIDVSGSMDYRNKLPLLKRAFNLLVDNLDVASKVAIVTYAGNERLVLNSTSIDDKTRIKRAINNLDSGGSTAGAAGIEKAYEIASRNFIEGGNNRIILATDGDFNVGVSSAEKLIELVRKHSKEKIFMTVCGFGMGNYKDHQMEEISNNGNGNYFYIDSWKEAKKVFEYNLKANLFTIAKDVKIQVEFNPRFVKGYRLIGYENRLLKADDFNDDTVDAGELGAGHTVTALYELIPTGSNQFVSDHDPLKYSKIKSKSDYSNSTDLFTIKFRYKALESEFSTKIETVVPHSSKLEKAGSDMQFAAATAGFGMLLRNSNYKGDLSYDKVINLARKGLTNDENGYRRDFILLVEEAKSLVSQTDNN